MKFLVSQIEIGRAVVAMNTMVAGIESIERQLHEQPVHRHHDRGDRQTGGEQDRDAGTAA